MTIKMLELSQLGTLLVGLVSFVISQVFLKSVVEPLQDFGKIRGRIAAALTLYASALLSDNIDKAEAARSEVRKLASELRGAIEILPSYRRRKDYYRAVQSLIGLSNFVKRADNDEQYLLRIMQIQQYLKLPSVEDILSKS